MSIRERMRSLPWPPGAVSALRIFRLSFGQYLMLVGSLLVAKVALQRQYEQHLADQILILGIAALGVNIVLGFAGLVSVAHAAIMALGAYTSALAMSRLHLPFALAFLLACAEGGLISGLVGMLGNRVRPNYFLLITVGIHQATFVLIVNTDWLTGGPTGLFDVPAASLGPWMFDTDRSFYLFEVPTFVLALFFAQRLRSSKAGRAMTALRQDDRAAMLIGVNVNRYRAIAMAVGGIYLAASGSLFAHLIGFLGPESFSLNLALLLTLMVVAGGIGSNLGVLISVVGLEVVTENLHAAGTSWVLYYGLLIMVLLVIAPRGLAGLVAAISDRLLPQPRPS